MKVIILDDFLTEGILIEKKFRKQVDELDWNQYENDFLELMDKRSIHKHLSPDLLDHGCLLCSEHEPHFCHRRLVVEFLNLNSDYNLTITHLY